MVEVEASESWRKGGRMCGFFAGHDGKSRPIKGAAMTRWAEPAGVAGYRGQFCIRSQGIHKLPTAKVDRVLPGH